MIDHCSAAGGPAKWRLSKLFLCDSQWMTRSPVNDFVENIQREDLTLWKRLMLTNV